MNHQKQKTGSCVAPESPSCTTEVEAVLDEYIQLKEAFSYDLEETVGGFLARWMAVRSEIEFSNRLNGASYNPLSFLKINETMHSRILGDLLDPNGSHCQGSIFLRPLLKMLEMPESDAGLWHVTIETGRVDILIWRNTPPSAIIIENKSNGAVDQPNQIYRYWHQEIFLWKPKLWTSIDENDVRTRKRRFHVVYLPTDGGKSPDSHSMERPPGLEMTNPCPRVPLDIQTLALSDLMALWAEDSIPYIPPENHRLRSFLSQYQELWTK